ncbi:MAG: phosphatase PAP2 family protein [Gemmatimonadetes bacterium]|nr:phosphatase PAP2 family protein [Gemmatimonadota bacterium]NNK49249.1 phosphatase PAP2 family protein [Gemmatimonadota bacterium]
MGRVLLVIAIVAAIVFTAFPDVDLWMSGLFYRPAGGFYLKDSWWAVAIYDSIPIIAITVGVGSLLLLVLNLVRKRQVGPLSNRFLLFMLAALAVGPGLVVNAGFKDNWGRARPRDITEFSGEKRFTPALQPTDQCDRNCSFVAGHPSVVFWLAALGFSVAARRRRNRIFVAAGALGLVAGFGRIVQGGHFFSDVIFSGLAVFAVVWVLARYVFRLDDEVRHSAEAESGQPRPVV